MMDDKTLIDVLRFSDDPLKKYAANRIEQLIIEEPDDTHCGEGDNFDTKKFFARLKQKHELTGAKIAALTGYHPAFVSMMKTGRRPIRVRFLQKLAQGLGKKLLIEFVDKE
jgi:hypothetical protein